LLFIIRGVLFIRYAGVRIDGHGTFDVHLRQSITIDLIPVPCQSAGAELCKTPQIIP